MTTVQRKIARTYTLVWSIYMLSYSFAMATYVMFLMDRGMNLFQVNLINTLFWLGTFFFEVPTGVFADTLGRKISFLIACCFLSLAMLTYALSSTLVGFITAELIAALGASFKSGALEAWVVDSLDKAGFPEKKDRLFANTSLASSGMSIIGGLIGAHAGAVNLAYPWMMGSVMFLITFLVAAIAIKEDDFERQKLTLRTAIEQMRSIARSGVHYGIRNRIVFLLSLTIFISGFSVQPLNMYWQPQFSRLAGGEVAILGWVWVFINLAIMGGNSTVRLLLKRVGRRSFLLILATLIISFPSIVAALLRNFFGALAFFLLHEAGRGMMEPVRTAYINEHIPSKERATLLSLASMFRMLGGTIGLLLFGMIAKSYSITISWVAAAFSLLLSIPIYIALREPRKLRDE